MKSKQRVADHGEVFTPAWMVAAMLDLVKGETERIDSRFLEPACGDGNFYQDRHFTDRWKRIKGDAAPGAVEPPTEPTPA